MSEALSIGLFVGGAGKRMGGVAKGLLLTPDGSETLVARLVRLRARVAPNARVYLVGRAAAYESLGIPALEDQPSGAGPIGGLRSLLLQAQKNGSTAALALACDLPFIDEPMLERLCLPLSCAARVPFVEAFYQPLSAAYAPEATLTAIERSLTLGKHALLYVLQILGSEVERLELGPEHAHTLRDWDTPEDVNRH